MYKRFILIVALLTVSSFAKEDSYIFEARGKFAKELKQLIEKYSKIGKLNIRVIKTSEDKSLISSLVGTQKNATDINLGKKIYNNLCFQCHGRYAQKSFYANARVLSTLSKNEIIDQVYNYKRDINYGGSTRFIMHNAVDSLNDRDMNSVATYIKNINKKNKKTIDNDNTSSIPINTDDNTEKSSYLQ